MTNPHVTEWAAQVRHELLDARVQLDHLEPVERGQHYRNVVSRAVKTLRERDPRANQEECLSALEELFPPWWGDGAPPPPPPTPPQQLTADELADQLVQAAAGLPDAEKEKLARKLRKILPLPPEQAGSDKLRERFGVAEGEGLDLQMVQMTLIALAELLEEIQDSAAETWVALTPSVQGRLESLMGGKKPQLARFLGQYLTGKWKENLQKVLKELQTKADRAKGLTISFDQTVAKMTEVIEAESPDPAALVELMRGLVELRIPNPTMIISMLNGGMVGGPTEFGRDFAFLFDHRKIANQVKANRPGADGRDFWNHYVRLAGDINPAYLSDTMRQKLVSGTANHFLCPPHIKP